MGYVSYVRIDWENSRHKKNARSVIYKGLNWYMGRIGERWGNWFLIRLAVKEEVNLYCQSIDIIIFFILGLVYRPTIRPTPFKCWM